MKNNRLHIYFYNSLFKLKNKSSFYRIELTCFRNRYFNNKVRKDGFNLLIIPLLPALSSCIIVLIN